jgi:hypothetical protein
VERIVGLILLFVLASADAALIDRGGGLIFDTEKNITWLQDASLGGLGDWAESVAWADGLVYNDTVRVTTWDDWRLPDITELSFLIDEYSISGTTPGPFVNISTTVGQDAYWAGPAGTSSGTPVAWVQAFNSPFTRLRDGQTFDHGAWAVRSGDVVPIPAAAWLFGSALGLLGWMRRKAS